MYRDVWRLIVFSINQFFNRTIVIHQSKKVSAIDDDSARCGKPQVAQAFTKASVKIKYDYVAQWAKYKDLHGRLSYLWEQVIILTLTNNKLLAFLFVLFPVSSENNQKKHPHKSSK